MLACKNVNFNQDNHRKNAMPAIKRYNLGTFTTTIRWSIVIENEIHA